MREPLFVEITPLLFRRQTGISRFAARLLEALSERRSLRLFTIATRGEARRDRLGGGLAFGEEIDVPRGSLPRADADLELWVRALWRLPRCRHDPERARAGPCLYTLFRPEVRHFAREVSVLYDLTPLLLPETHEAWTRTVFGRYFARALPLSDAVVAISASTRADAVWLTASAPEKIAVVSPGPSLCCAVHASAAEVERRRDLVLVVATREPRKNARFVHDWFHSTRALPADAELCWAGPRGWLGDGVLRRQRDGGGRRFRFTGALSDAALCELYRRAAFTVYPSLYEGFGLPVLDSLRHGAPVAVSFHSSLKEFEGPGVFYFDPYDASSLEAAVREIGAAPATFGRPDLEERCSWASAAETVLSLLD